LGFGVQGPGSRVQGPGSRVQGPGFRVQGAGSRDKGVELRVHLDAASERDGAVGHDAPVLGRFVRRAERRLRVHTAIQKCEAVPRRARI